MSWNWMATVGRRGCVAGLAAAALAVSACEIRESPAPALTGPSELGLSLTLSASPDVLTQDGASQSQLMVHARDANSAPLRDVPVRLEIYVGGVLFDFGRLSARNLVTGTDGRAFAVYTAPPRPAESVDDFTIVTILATPTGTNYASALPRQLEIRLVPPGPILPPNVPPVADFTFTPQAPVEGQTVFFDAGLSTDSDGRIVSYTWDFGDRGTGTGARASHAYTSGGTFNVTLTVVDDRNVADTETKAITVSTSARPTAAFSISPTSPRVNERVTVNASASQAAPGRRIDEYSWTFGDGHTDEGQITSHSYATPGSYTITLTVEDDLGRTGTTSQSVTVAAAELPTPVIVVSPANPQVGQPVNFDGTGSRAPTGRFITQYEWNMGDGTIRTGSRITHTYSVAGSFTVQLRVHDSASQFATTTQIVTVTQVAVQPPTAEFTASPSPAPVGTFVTFDASASRAQSGQVLVRFEWNFGDSTTVYFCPGYSDTETQCGANSFSTVRHRYTSTGAFTVTLTVVDSLGRRGTASRTIQIQ